jgi:deazaflavin-dependent oxidoreductase (nitroreductase family)
MTFYRRPMMLTQIFNKVASWFASAGVTPSRMITLEVKGRRTGEVRWNPLNVVEHEGQRYLVSPRGESEWVRNVRAAGGEAVIRHGGREKVRLEDIAAEERAPILKAYLGENAMTTRQHFGVDPKAELSEFEAIAARHPAFRITAME